MTQQEAGRYHARVAMFIRRGLQPADAESFAERCFFRDRERDDRRGCIECSKLQADGRCRAPGQHAGERTLLQRCPDFDWQIPRNPTPH